MLNKLTNKQAQKFVANFEPFFKSLPHLPQGLINFLVAIVPWLAGLGGLGSIISGLGVFNNINLLAAIQLITGALLLLAFNPLRNRQLKGWMYLFWVAAINLAGFVFGIIYGSAALTGGTLIGVTLQLYLLFEIKPSYK